MAIVHSAKDLCQRLAIRDFTEWNLYTHPVVCLSENSVVHTRSQGVHRFYPRREKVRHHVIRVVAYQGKKCFAYP